LQNKQYYINEFKSRVKPWRFGTADKAWYRPRYEWRLVFDFNEADRHWAYSPVWRQMLETFEAGSWNFRRRAEYTCTIFTSEPALLDAVLSNDQWMNCLTEVQYSDDSYLKAFTTNAGIDAVSDIKFVARVPEHQYQVTLGNFEWRGEEDLKFSIAEYLLNNQHEYVFKGHEADLVKRMNDMVRRYSTNLRNGHINVMNGFKFWAKNTDDILMFHMMAPGKIIKIIKLMEKNRETIIG
jgi:hypothetical protein